VRVVLPGNGWTLSDEDRPRIEEELANLGHDPDLIGAAELVTAAIKDGRFERPGQEFHPRVEMHFHQAPGGARGDRDLSLDIIMDGWAFSDDETSRSFHKALNLIDSPTLQGKGALIDHDFVSMVQDEIENLILAFHAEGRITPKGRTEFVFQMRSE
jgi:hypothetical protein